VRSIRHLLRKCCRGLGYDIVQLRPASSLSAHLSILFARLHINCVIDVGAHFGEYGQFLRDNGYQGHIVSFEPVNDSFGALQRRVSRDSKWTAHQAALGGQAQTASINVLRSSAHTSFLSPSTVSLKEHGPGIGIHRTESVRMERLDDIFAKYVAHLQQPRVYLKMDTQGWDLEVLKGADGCLASILALQSEIAVRPMYDGMPTWIESISCLNEKGFELTGLFPVAHARDLRLLELDCVMARARALGRDSGWRGVGRPDFESPGQDLNRG
jgi:FkbM family methyltransferase